MEFLYIAFSALGGAAAASAYWLARFKDLKVEFAIALEDAKPKPKAATSKSRMKVASK